MPKLKPIDLDEVERRYAAGERYCDIAASIGVSKATLSARRQKAGLPPGPKGPKGPSSWNWKGGRHVDPRGYTHVAAPEHPRATSTGYVREHLLVMEEHLGRPVKRGEVVHHINGDKSDNRIENLMLFPNQSAHMRWHFGPGSQFTHAISAASKTAMGRGAVLRARQ